LRLAGSCPAKDLSVAGGGEGGTGGSFTGGDALAVPESVRAGGS
jgi:hypothetical protein